MANNVPLTTNSVFVSATPPPGATSNDSQYTLNSNRAQSITNSIGDLNSLLSPSILTSPTGNAPSPSSASSRRSRAHQLRLLGLNSDGNRIYQDGEGASEDVLLTGLSSNSTPITARSRMEGATSEENQFGVGRVSEEEEDVEIERIVERGEQNNRKSFNSNQSTANPNDLTNQQNTFRPSGTYDELDLESQDPIHNPFDDEEYDYLRTTEYSHHSNGLVKLPFEPIIRRERIWMWTSTAFVIALSIISIAIAVNWIDWPGDGIGKN